jgi:hypothetical protein
MSMGSAERGASDDQISRLPSRRYKAVDTDSEFRNSVDCDSTVASADPVSPSLKIHVAKLPYQHAIRA